MKVGDVFITNSGLNCSVIKIVNNKKVIIKFHNTGSVREVYIENLLSGKVRDLYNPSCYGIGYLGDIDKTIPYYKQAVQLWRNMFKRCYSEKDDRGYRGSVIVDTRWHNLATFIADLPKLENFNKWLQGGTCTKTKYQLDKDCLGDGSVYSVHTCKFITEHENKSLGAINARNWDSRYNRNRPLHKIKKF